MKTLSLKDLNLANKKVLMRVDFNVPIKDGKVGDDSRITAAIPSIKYVLDHGGALILMSHLGRPNGKPTPQYSLAPSARRLSELLGKDVAMAPDCIGTETTHLAKNLKSGEVLMLENLRFHEAEEHPEQDPTFAKKLAELGDVYVNDAFGTVHRAHSSTATIAQYFPNKAAVGFLMEKEIEFLGSTLLNPSRPFYAIIGGAKISSKIGVLKALLEKVDALLIGGGMAFTFFKAQGIPIGDSIHEDEQLDVALSLLENAREKGVKLILPVDEVIASKPINGAETQVIKIENGIPAGFQGVDIGPKTIELFSSHIRDAATIFWNGPLGIFEQSEYSRGTFSIAKAVSVLPAIKIIGGGDSVAAVKEAGLESKMTHLSTGGGATLEYIEYGQLPGIEALTKMALSK